MHPFSPAKNKTFDDLDTQYRSHYLSADARQTSIAIAVWLVPMLLFAYGDYLIWGFSPKFAGALALRLVFCIFSLYTIFALTKVVTPRDYDRIFLHWAMAAVAVVVYINYSWAPLVPPNGIISILIIFSAYLLFPSSLHIRLAPPLTLSIANLILGWWVVDTLTPYMLLTSLVAVAMANVLGIIFSSSLQKHRYTEFVSHLEESRIKEELIMLASFDELTGVFNRRKLIELASEEYERFVTGGQPFSVLMMDVDNFKQLNDSFGHAAGDFILAKFAAYVAKSLDVGSIWGRLGGDEFTLVLPGISGAEAKLIAERLHLDLNLEPIIWQNEQLNYTISIGITEKQAQDHSFENLLRRADQALYHAKRNGRNRTEML